MLTFLRKIRRSLVESLPSRQAGGSARKYMFYAIGEILLVMIGILLALQVNNWNEEKRRNEKLKVHFVNLKQEMQTDIVTWHRQKNDDIFRYYALQHLLKLAHQKPLILNSDEQMLPYSPNSKWKDPFPDFPDKQFLAIAFRESIRWGNIAMNKSTIEELKSTGLFSHIRDELKNGLNKLYVEHNWRVGERNMLAHRQLNNRWEVSLSTSGVVPSDLSNVENPIELLSDNPERVAILKQFIRQARWRAISADILEKLAINLLQEIDEEIIRI